MGGGAAPVATAGAPDYPMPLGLAYLMLVGYTARMVFISLKLPGPVAIIFVGLIMSYFMEPKLLSARSELQRLAFFLVLMNAGFEISIREVRTRVIVISTVPAFFEIAGITIFGIYGLGWPGIEALVLAVTTFCLGEGIVIPKMNEFRKQFPGHPIPKLVLAWAPLEATLALAFFGILVGLSEPAHRPAPNILLLVVGSILQVVVTLIAGAILGTLSGALIGRRTKLMIRGKKVFTGTTVEAFLLILGVCLVAYAVGHTEILAMPFADGEAFFQPELFVIVTGSFFANASHHDLLEGVEQVVNGVWVFGALVLFSMIGSRTKTSDFAQLGKILPIMLVGVVFRVVGVAVATLLTLRVRPCGCTGCKKEHQANAPYEFAFCFLSTLPRATIQGALGALPIQEEFFASAPNREVTRQFIATTARLYIICFAVVGSVLLEILGPRLLEATYHRKNDCLGPPPSSSFCRCRLLGNLWGASEAASGKVTDLRIGGEDETHESPTSAKKH